MCPTHLNPLPTIAEPFFILLLQPAGGLFLLKVLVVLNNTDVGVKVTSAWMTGAEVSQQNIVQNITLSPLASLLPTVLSATTRSPP